MKEKQLQRYFDLWFQENSFDQSDREKMETAFKVGISMMKERFAGYDEAINNFLRSDFIKAHHRNVTLKEFRQRLTEAKPSV